MQETMLREKVFSTIQSLTPPNSIVIDASTPLIGDGSVLDSMKLVELCLALEDAASAAEFSFDWTSEAAMSRSRSMFRTAGALAEEFIRQSKGEA